MEKGLEAPPAFHPRRSRSRVAVGPQGSVVIEATLPFFEKRPYDVEKTGNMSDDQPQTAKHRKSFTSTTILLIGLSISLALAVTRVDL